MRFKEKDNGKYFTGIDYDTLFDRALLVDVSTGEETTTSLISHPPNNKASDVYDKLFADYDKLHNYSGRGENNVMKRHKDIKKGK